MAGVPAPKKPDFATVLEQGARVDDIFKDAPSPKGTDPFGADSKETEEGPVLGPLAVEEADQALVAAAATSDEGGVATFIDNDSLFCINRKFAAIEALFKLITRDYSFGQLVGEILRVAMEQVKSEAGSFLEIDHQNQCMFFRAAAGRASENLLNFTVPLGQGIAGFVCETQQPMTLSSIDESSVYLRSISNAVGFETRNLAAYPLVIRGVTFGCLELLNRLGEPQYTDADKEVLTTIVDYAAKVIENRLVTAELSKELAAFKGGKTEEKVA